MDIVKTDEELTSTMGNVLSISKEEKNDTSDATPTSSTDANTNPKASQTVSDDPISSTSSDNFDQSKPANMNRPSVDEPDRVQTEDHVRDFLEIPVSNEKITEDVEDLVHDLESLLGETSEPYTLPVKQKEPAVSVAEKKVGDKIHVGAVQADEESLSGETSEPYTLPVKQKETAVSVAGKKVGDKIHVGAVQADEESLSGETSEPYTLPVKQKETAVSVAEKKVGDKIHVGAVQADEESLSGETSEPYTLPVKQKETADSVAEKEVGDKIHVGAVQADEESLSGETSEPYTLPVKQKETAVSVAEKKVGDKIHVGAVQADEESLSGETSEPYTLPVKQKETDDSVAEKEIGDKIHLGAVQIDEKSLSGETSEPFTLPVKQKEITESVAEKEIGKKDHVDAVHADGEKSCGSNNVTELLTTENSAVDSEDYTKKTKYQSHNIETTKITEESEMSAAVERASEETIEEHPIDSGLEISVEQEIDSVNEYADSIGSWELVDASEADSYVSSTPGPSGEPVQAPASINTVEDITSSGDGTSPTEVTQGNENNREQEQNNPTEDIENVSSTEKVGYDPHIKEIEEMGTEKEENLQNNTNSKETKSEEKKKVENELEVVEVNEVKTDQETVASNLKAEDVKKVEIIDEHVEVKLTKNEDMEVYQQENVERELVKEIVTKEQESHPNVLEVKEMDTVEQENDNNPNAAKVKDIEIMQQYNIEKHPEQVEIKEMETDKQQSDKDLEIVEEKGHVESSLKAVEEIECEDLRPACSANSPKETAVEILEAEELRSEEINMQEKTSCEVLKTLNTDTVEQESVKSTLEVADSDSTCKASSPQPSILEDPQSTKPPEVTTLEKDLTEGLKIETPKSVEDNIGEDLEVPKPAKNEDNKAQVVEVIEPVIDTEKLDSNEPKSKNTEVETKVEKTETPDEEEIITSAPEKSKEDSLKENITEEIAEAVLTEQKLEESQEQQQEKKDAIVTEGIEMPLNEQNDSKLTENDKSNEEFIDPIEGSSKDAGDVAENVSRETFPEKQKPNEVFTDPIEGTSAAGDLAEIGSFPENNREEVKPVEDNKKETKESKQDSPKEIVVVERKEAVTVREQAQLKPITERKQSHLAELEFAPLQLSEDDSDDSETVPRLALDPDESNSPLVADTNELHSEETPPMEEILEEKQVFVQTVIAPVVDTSDNLETMLAVASLQNIDIPKHSEIDHVVSEKERREMEALAIAVQSITDNTNSYVDNYIESPIIEDSIAMHEDPVFESHVVEEQAETVVVAQELDSTIKPQHLQSEPTSLQVHESEEEKTSQSVTTAEENKAAESQMEQEMKSESTTTREINTPDLHEDITQDTKPVVQIVVEKKHQVELQNKINEDINIEPESTTMEATSDSVVDDQTRKEEYVPEILGEKNSEVIEEIISDVTEKEVVKAEEKEISNVTEKEVVKAEEKEISNVTEKEVVKAEEKEISNVTEKEVVKAEEKEISNVTEKEVVKAEEKEISNVTEKEAEEKEVSNVTEEEVKDMVKEKSTGIIGEKPIDVVEEKINENIEDKAVENAEEMLIKQGSNEGSQNSPSSANEIHFKESKKSKSNEKSKKHKKEKYEELTINIDDQEKDVTYSPRITIKPIKVPDDEVSTTTSGDSEISKGSLKMTITKQSDNMHSILKISDQENSEALPEQEEPIPKLIIKPKMQQVEQHSPKMSTRSSKQSPTGSNQRSGSPRITIKPVVKPDKQEPVSPIKIKINTKVNVKAVVREEEISKKMSNKPAKCVEEVEPIQSPRITIKPIPKPDSEKEANPKLTIKPIKKPEEDIENEEKERCSPKITIKPLVKPQESETVHSVDDEEVKERIVLKINKGNLPSPVKISKKREHPPDDEKSEKLSKITVKFSKEGGHPHIVHQQGEEVSTKRVNDEVPGNGEKNKKQKVDVESVISTRSSARHKEQLEANEKPNPKSPESKSKHKDPIHESPVETKRARKDNLNDKSKLLKDDSCDEVLLYEPKVDSPIVISEDSRSQDSVSVILLDESKDDSISLDRVTTPKGNSEAESASDSPLPRKRRGRPKTRKDSGNVILLDEPKDDSLERIENTKVLSEGESASPSPVPKKRGRPRKVPIEIREEAKHEESPKPTPSQQESPKPKEPEVSQQAVHESGRPKRSCRGQSVCDTLGIKPRKPRGPGRGRGSKTGMGNRLVAEPDDPPVPVDNLPEDEKVDKEKESDKTSQNETNVDKVKESDKILKNLQASSKNELIIVIEDEEKSEPIPKSTRRGRKKLSEKEKKVEHREPVTSKVEPVTSKQESVKKEPEKIKFEAKVVEDSIVEVEAVDSKVNVTESKIESKTPTLETQDESKKAITETNVGNLKRKQTDKVNEVEPELQVFIEKERKLTEKDKKVESKIVPEHATRKSIDKKIDPEIPIIEIDSGDSQESIQNVATDSKKKDEVVEFMDVDNNDAEVEVPITQNTPTAAVQDKTSLDDKRTILKDLDLTKGKTLEVDNVDEDVETKKPILDAPFAILAPPAIPKVFSGLGSTITSTQGLEQSSSCKTSNPEISPVSSTTVPAEVMIVDEDTRMSAETNSRAQTPAKQVITSSDLVEESQSSVHSTATTESGKTPSRPSKVARLEVQESDNQLITADLLTEYYWNGNGPFMLQEQVAQFLGIKSFKRKYPGIMRRMLDMQERDFIREKGLASEHMCDLGLTAVNSADILDIMYSDFQEKYEEYCKHQRDRQAKELINKQKALSLATSQEKSKADITEQAVHSAAQWNARFNKERRDQRKACMDLQNFTVHYPKGKKVPIETNPHPGNYPVALVPGQFAEYYKEFTPTELNNLPIQTIGYDEVHFIPREESDDSGSESDSDSSGGSSGSCSCSSSDSDSSSGVEDCKLCKHSPKNVATPMSPPPAIPAIATAK